MSIEPHEVRYFVGQRVKPTYETEAKPVDLPSSILRSENPMLALAKSEGHRKALPKSVKARSDAARKATEARLRGVESKAEKVLAAMKPGTEYLVRDLSKKTGMASTEVGNCISSLKKKGLVQMVRRTRNAGVWRLAE